MPEELIEINLGTRIDYSQQGGMIEQSMMQINSRDKKQASLKIDLCFNALSCENVQEFLLHLVNRDQQQVERKNIIVKEFMLTNNRLATLQFLTPQISYLFQRITGLYLQGNLFTSLNGLQHINTSFLQSLAFSDNKILVEELEQFFSKRDLAQLRYLFIESNQLKDVRFLEENHNMGKLERVFLGGNRILKVDFTKSAFVDSLQQLYLAFNQLSFFPPSFSQLTNLKQLDLSCNKITSVQVLRFIDPNHTLEILHLDKNLITSAKFLSHLNFHNLRSLHLDQNQIVQLSPYTIRRAKLPSLTKIFINSNLLSGYFFNELLVGLKQNKLTFADFRNHNYLRVGKIGWKKWIKKNIGWEWKPFQ